MSEHEFKTEEEVIEHLIEAGEFPCQAQIF